MIALLITFKGTNPTLNKIDIFQLAVNYNVNVLNSHVNIERFHIIYQKPGKN